MKCSSSPDSGVCTKASLSTSEEEQCACHQYTPRPVGPWSACLVTVNLSTPYIHIHYSYIYSLNALNLLHDILAQVEGGGGSMQLSPGHQEQCGKGKRFRLTSKHPFLRVGTVNLDYYFLTKFPFDE